MNNKINSLVTNIWVLLTVAVLGLAVFLIFADSDGDNNAGEASGEEAADTTAVNNQITTDKGSAASNPEDAPDTAISVGSDLGVVWPQDLIEPSTVSDFSQAEALVWKANSLGVDLSSSWAADGSYYSRSDACETAYNSETNVLFGYCTIGSGANAQQDFFKWSNVVSAGYHSDKYTQTLTTGVAPTFAFLNSVYLPDGSDGFVSADITGEPEELDDVSPQICDSLFSLTDSASGLPVAVKCGTDADGDVLLKASGINVSSAGSVLADVKELEALVSEASDVAVEDWGFSEVSLAEAQQRVNHKLPKTLDVGGFELVENFHSRNPRLSEAANPASAGMVVQVYRDGLREIVVTSRSAANPTGWVNDPLAISDDGPELGASGWSEIASGGGVVPPHFWGVSEDSVVTVEGYNVDSQTLSSVRSVFAG